MNAARGRARNVMKSVDQLIGKSPLWAACMILIVIPALFLIFHALILAGTLPRNIVWGGRLTDVTFLPLELLAITLNLLLIITGGVAGKFVTSKGAKAVVDQLKWFLFYFVLVNTIAGLFSTTMLEVLMTPITALYTLCLYRIIRFSDGFGSVAKI